MAEAGASVAGAGASVEATAGASVTTTKKNDLLYKDNTVRFLHLDFIQETSLYVHPFVSFPFFLKGDKFRGDAQNRQRCPIIIAIYLYYRMSG